MKIVIIGGGIAAVYAANKILEKEASHEVLLLSDESHLPYDRIHLCRLIDDKQSMESIALPLHEDAKVFLNQCVTHIDTNKKIITSNEALFSYDKLILATGSTPLSLIDKNIENSAVFRNAYDAQKIKEAAKNHEIVVVGSGPIALELLETLNAMHEVAHMTLLVRGKHLYSKHLSHESIQIIQDAFLKENKITISYEDEIVNYDIQNNHMTQLHTKKLNIANPFIVFGVGIKPNIESFKPFFKCQKGILVDDYMQTNVKDVYAIGECAEVKSIGFVAGHVKECTTQANSAIAHMLEEKECLPYGIEVATDMLKVGEFDLVEVGTFNFTHDYEKVVIASKQENRCDEYFVKDKSLIHFIGINSNVDIAYIEELILSGEAFDLNYLYENRIIGERGRLICSCAHIYHQDLVDLVVQTGVANFTELKDFSEAGRICGRCKKMVEDVIEQSQSLVDPNMPKKTPQEIQLEKELKAAQKRVEKFKKLHPKNGMDESNLEAALKMVDIGKDEVNSWVSMVTASMKLNPAFEPLVQTGVKTLNKVPIVWLELSDCSGNSEAFIKSSNPALEDLIFDYISLDYHELLMSASGDQSETVLEQIITQHQNEFVLIVEGAVPLGLDGKYLRIGPKGETGIELLQRCAKNAALVIAVGSCAFDGGVVSAYPNPTQAVGVADALKREDIINIPGCPTNPINIVGTLLSYLMFEELPQLDASNRPLWAYEQRVHDNCERRGHYELGEFVKHWGDEGAKKGWCLFEMGCKGPFTNVNCPTMKFNLSTSWPVQAGHGCMGCTEKGFFDKFAHERLYIEEKSENK
jgi:quinone-reactive Ni/Fe-hydrogenase small subunit